MSDDVTAAVERFRGLIAPFSDGYVRVVSRSCGGYNAHNYDEGICRDCGFDGMNPTGEMLLGEAQDLLAHIDGEPARTAAACEEVREACAQRVPSIGQPHDCFEAVRATPLTATPLADALRLANETVVKLAQASTEAQASAAEGVRYWTDLAQAEARDAAALRARVAELEAAANTAGADASAAALRAMARATNAEAERDEAQRGEQEAWRQTDQMRAERDALRAQVEAARTYARQTLDYGEDCDATDLLAAMDEAKP